MERSSPATKRLQEYIYGDAGKKLKKLDERIERFYQNAKNPIDFNTGKSLSYFERGRRAYESGWSQEDLKFLGLETPSKFSDQLQYNIGYFISYLVQQDL